MGSAVKAMLVNRYDKSELAGLYTDSELEQIGFQSDISIAAKYKDVYQRSEAVAQIHYVAEDMGDITITYTNGTVSDSTTEFMYPDDVYEDTLALSKLPLGENNVVITITDEMDNVLSERTQKMYIVADQPAVDIHNSGIAFHIDIGKKDNLELIRKLGFTRIRADFPWERIETSSGFNFTQTDTFMAETARLGISVVPILSYNNSIYSDDGNVKGAVNTAAESAAFVNYVRAVAGRYPGITEYEIWNEPNNGGFWSDAANVNEYSALVTAASAALYEINPDIKVYAGSIDVSKSGDSFAGSMFSNGLYDYMDALSIHPYFRTGGTSFDSRLSTYKSIILNNGGFKKLAATEFNFNISSGETDVTRGREAAKAMVLAEANNVDDVFFYTLVSDDYGLLDTEYELKSTIFPLSYVNSVLADARFIGKTTSGSISKYVFIKTSGEEVSICWSSSSSSYTLQSGETAYDMNGNALSGSSVAISSAPVYIFGTHNANSAKTAEINSRISAITSRYPSITSSMLSASNAKARIMATSLSEKDKSTALYMLHEVKKIEAVYASLTDTSNLAIPARTLAAADHGNNVYAKAALKLAGSYVSECQKVSDMSFTGKNNILAADIMIANDLIESALLLAPATAPAIKDVKVVNGLLTFSVKNIQSGDVWVATYASGVLTDLKAVDINNLSCEVGNGAGKIFVWDGLRPLCPAAAFGN